MNTLGTKSGAVVVVTMEGQGPDGQKFTWELRHPLIVETQSWRSRGLLYGLIAAGVLCVVGWYMVRRWRRWAKKKAAAGPPPNPAGFGDVEKSDRAAVPEPPQDDSPPPGNLFGAPPS